MYVQRHVLVQEVTKPVGGNGQSYAFPWPENADFQDSKSLQAPARPKSCHAPNESLLLSALNRYGTTLNIK